MLILDWTKLQLVLTHHARNHESLITTALSLLETCSDFNTSVRQNAIVIRTLLTAIRSTESSIVCEKEVLSDVYRMFIESSHV